jgi:asparagine synthase (glutamine-hydrolysing)
MCGIAGKYYFGTDKEVELGVIEAMTDVMSHRGPDDRGVYRGKNVALGHRRLSILDLSPTGHQPMSNEDGTVWVIFNGEIYDYKRLRTELQAQGHIFRSTTDTEVIVHAYEEYGIDCVPHFDGMFAFAIWDSRLRRLVLARDHFGIKPLYYFDSPEFISFASEIKSILADPQVAKRVDPQALSNFLTLHYVPAPRTMFDGIRKLLPGHLMVVEKGRTRVQQYWELCRNEPLPMKEEEAAECIYSQLKHSVAQRLQSDVPVGTLLSGGLDSSAVLGLMTEVAQKPIPAFSVGYSGNGNDGFSEFRYSRLVAKHFNSDYHEAVVTPQMFLDFLPKAVWYQDEPIGEPASIPLYYVCKLAKDRGITVLLSGEGSDEIFAGYNRHIGEMFSRYYGLLPSQLTRSAAWLFSLLPRVPVLRKGHRAMALRDFWPRYQSWHTVFSDDLKDHLLGTGPPMIESFADTFAPYKSAHDGLDNLTKLLWLDIKVWLPDDLLMKKDRMGMATSLEARVPFLDHRFAEMVFNLSSNLKVRRLTGKYVFKKSMERVLPKEIIYRKKQGFPTPISRWMARELRQPITDILSASGVADHGYFNRKVVKRLMDEHASGRENHERLLFPILNFDVWYQTFFQHAHGYEPELSAVPSVA